MRWSDENVINEHVIPEDDVVHAVKLLAILSGGPADASSPLVVSKSEGIVLSPGLRLALSQFIAVLATRRQAVVHVLDPVDRVSLRQAAYLARTTPHVLRQWCSDGELEFSRRANGADYQINLGSLLKTIGKHGLSAGLWKEGSPRVPEHKDVSQEAKPPRSSS